MESFILVSQSAQLSHYAALLYVLPRHTVRLSIKHILAGNILTDLIIQSYADTKD